jgi:excisionase family DNA binding protein
MENKATMTVDQAAVYLGISRAFAFRMVSAGEIPSVRLGRRILVPRAALEQWLANVGQKAA